MFNQQAEQESLLDMSRLSLQRNKSSFRVEMNLDFLHPDLDTDTSRTIVPVLSDDVHSLELPSLIIAGTKRCWLLRWLRFRLGDQVFGAYKIKKIQRVLKDVSSSYVYRESLSYESWMDNSRIRFIIK